MNQMSSQEYKDLVNYLVDKGVIARPEPLGFDPGEPVYIKGGQAWLEPTGTMRVNQVSRSFCILLWKNFTTGFALNKRRPRFFKASDEWILHAAKV